MDEQQKKIERERFSNHASLPNLERGFKLILPSRAVIGRGSLSSPNWLRAPSSQNQFENQPECQRKDKVGHST